MFEESYTKTAQIGNGSVAYYCYYSGRHLNTVQFWTRDKIPHGACKFFDKVVGPTELESVTSTVSR